MSEKRSPPAGVEYDPFARKQFYSMMGETWDYFQGATGALTNRVLEAFFCTGADAYSYYLIFAVAGVPLTKASEFEWYVGGGQGVPGWTSNGGAPCLMAYTSSFSLVIDYTLNISRFGFFFVKDATYNNRVLAITANGSGQTRTDLGSFPSAPTAYKVVFKPGDRVEYYINGSLVATHTTNLPSGAGRITMWFGITSHPGAAGNKTIYLKQWRGFADY